jgi:flagellum-specific peptidoglycan hydrolase FlgJ
LTGCGVRKVRIKENTLSKTQSTPKAEQKAQGKTSKPSVKTAKNQFQYNPKQSTAERIAYYIEVFSPVAQKEMAEFRIPASITLAQGLLESGNGSGRLAREANNHFGIKCHSDWNGKRIYHDDDRKGECFRVYQNPFTSYRDHSLFLTERSRYAFLFDLNPTNYKAWARGLKKAGYATDPNYPQKLIRLIERYQLDRFDKKVKIKKRTAVAKVKYRASKEHHTVQKGDTLYSIARQYEIPVKELIRVNKIKNNTIYPGQELTLPQLD